MVEPEAKLHLRIRQNTHPKHAGLCDVWVIGEEGRATVTEFGLLHGTMSPDRAELLATSLGLEVRREEQKLMCSDDTIEERAKDTEQQTALF